MSHFQISSKPSTSTFTKILSPEEEQEEDVHVVVDDELEKGVRST